MFIVRYLMVALAVAGIVAGWGISAGYGFWQVLGLMFGATMVLQILMLVYVGVAAYHRKHGSCRSARKRSDQLVILPR